MVNNVIGVVNYVIAARPSLLNFMIADNQPKNVAEVRSGAVVEVKAAYRWTQHAALDRTGTC
jgi:hypothetical protein